MRRFQALGVILVDCWSSKHSLSLPKNALLYNNIKQFLEERIDYEYLISTTPDLDPLLKALPGKHEYVTEWEDICNLRITTSNWIIAGQAWQVCFHYWINGYIKTNHPNMNLFTNNKIVDHDHMTSRSVDCQDFKNDSIISWSYQVPVDLWAVDSPYKPKVRILI